MRRNLHIKRIADTLEVKAIADSFVGSADSSRFITIVLVVASFLGFITYWTTLPGSWQDQHLRMAKYAYRHYELLENEDQLNTKLDSLTSVLICPIAVADSLIRARLWLTFMEFPEKEDLRQYIQEIERLRIQRKMSVEVSAFGVSLGWLHVNDFLSLIGFAFTIILGWLWFTLRREFTNLKIVFDKAREKNQLKVYYEFLAMRQVLMVPRMPEKPKRGYLSHSPKLLFFLPLCVQFTIVWNDLRTLTYGILLVTYNRFIAVSVLGGLFFLFATVYFSIRCFLLSMAIDRAWDNAYGEISKKGM